MKKILFAVICATFTLGSCSKQVDSELEAPALVKKFITVTFRIGDDTVIIKPFAWLFDYGINIGGGGPNDPDYPPAGYDWYTLECEDWGSDRTHLSVIQFEHVDSNGDIITYEIPEQDIVYYEEPGVYLVYAAIVE